MFSTYEGVLHLENDIVDTGWLDQITVHKVRSQNLAEKMYCWCQRLSNQADKLCERHGNSIALEPLCLLSAIQNT